MIEKEYQRKQQIGHSERDYMKLEAIKEMRSRETLRKIFWLSTSLILISLVLLVVFKVYYPNNELLFVASFFLGFSLVNSIAVYILIINSD